MAVIVLSLFTTFSHEGGKSGLTNNFFLNLLFEALYFVFVWLVYKFIAPKFMQLAEKINVSYSVVIASLILSLGMAYIAELVGLSAVVGAFFGGLAIRQTKQEAEVNSSVSAIGYSVFIPTFFVNIGLSMTFASIGQDFLFIVVMTVLGVLSKYWAGKYSSEIFGLKPLEGSIVGAGDGFPGGSGLDRGPDRDCPPPFPKGHLLQLDSGHHLDDGSLTNHAQPLHQKRRSAKLKSSEAKLRCFSYLQTDFSFCCILVFFLLA